MLAETAPADSPALIDLEPLRTAEEQRERNEKLKSGPNDTRCIMCHRPVDDQHPTTWWIWLTIDLRMIPLDTPDAAAANLDDLGMHPIGPTCARKVPAAYKQQAAAPTTEGTTP